MCINKFLYLQCDFCVQILRILNGEPYPVLSDGESEEDRGVTQVTDRMQSFNIQTVSHTDSGLFSMSKFFGYIIDF